MNAITAWWYWNVKRKLTRDHLAMKIAWLLPRRVASWAYVRVYVAGNPNGPPSNEYAEVGRAWDKGAGR